MRLPFVLAETAIGIFSRLTGQLHILPPMGVDTPKDITTLMSGFLAEILGAAGAGAR